MYGRLGLREVDRPRRGERLSEYLRIFARGEDGDLGCGNMCRFLFLTDAVELLCEGLIERRRGEEGFSGGGLTNILSSIGMGIPTVVC